MSEERLGKFVFQVVPDPPERQPHTPCQTCLYYQPGRLKYEGKTVDGCGYVAMMPAHLVRKNQKTIHCNLWKPAEMEPDPEPEEKSGPLMIDARWFAVVFLVQILVWALSR